MDLSKLPTLTAAQQQRRAQPKPPSRIARAIEKQKATQADRRRLQTWGMHVKNRDQWKDRYTGRPVRKTTEADPNRAEAHHIESKADEAVRYDTRNGICLSWATHEQVERNELKIIGTKFFTKGGKRYIDARYPVTFRMGKSS